MSSVKFVPACGTGKIPLVIVGQCPGREEMEQGKPFVGRSGKLLTKMLEYIGINREDITITNLIKVHPEGNRNPTNEEAVSWLPSLMEELEELKPKVILTLGSYASKILLGSDIPISKLRGKSYKFAFGSSPDGLADVVPTFH